MARRIGRPSAQAKTITALALSAALLAALAGCSSSAAPVGAGADNGTTLTMWARNSGGTVPKDLVDAYNKSHKNQIKLTVIPGESYTQKVGAAAGSNSLPDLLAADVVYSPNYVQQGLYQDITDKLKALPFYDSLTPAHSNAASKQGRLYGAPFIVDSSLYVYNKDLFAAAGLDPNKGPASLSDVYGDAKAIREKVGGDTYGFYFAGACPGCNIYTMAPYASAGKAPLFTNDGTKVHMDSKPMRSAFDTYKKMWDEGIVPSGAKDDDGSLWTTSFNAGKIGILPVGTFAFAGLKDVSFDWGVAPIPAPDGGTTSTFVGGDVIGISASSKHTNQAWDFISWSLGKGPQVDIIAKSGNLPVRVDLAENKYSSQDPRIVQAIKGLETGDTPSSVSYNQVFNDVTGPWLKGLRDYVFAGDPNALANAQKSAQAIVNSK